MDKHLKNSSTDSPRKARATHLKAGKRASKRSKENTEKTNLIVHFISFLCVILIIFSGYKIYVWYKDSNDIQVYTDEINNSVTIDKISDDENVIVVKSNEAKSNPYWDYIKMDLIDVNLSELEKTNEDVVGWIQVNGTNINYPFVQTTNNDYYLTHSFNKKYNQAGWVFLDYRNNVKSFNKNTIIYAHSRLDKTMFGSLKNLLKSNWYDDKNNHIIKLSTKKQNTLWQVFSVYHLPTTNDYLKINFSNNSEFKSFAKMLQDRSVYDFHTTVDEQDKILTLSTCYKNNQKMVMHAKLIKYFNK